MAHLLPWGFHPLSGFLDTFLRIAKAELWRSTAPPDASIRSSALGLGQTSGHMQWLGQSTSRMSTCPSAYRGHDCLVDPLEFDIRRTNGLFEVLR
jgi:hypothetical protein